MPRRSSRRQSLATERVLLTFWQTDPSRAFLSRDEVGKGYANQRFQFQHIEALAHWLEQYERGPWSQKKIIAARNNPLFAAYGKPWLQSYLGAGKKPRRAWTIMAYMLAGLMLEAS